MLKTYVMKRIIKLSERELHSLIKESVKKIIKEWHDYDTYEYDDIDPLDVADSEYDAMMDEYLGVEPIEKTNYNDENLPF